MLQIRIIGWSSILGLSVACATATPGARPHDMSAAGHEHEAEEHAATAATHMGQYDSSADTTRERCRVGAGPGARASENFAVCWTSVTNPTDTHLRQAEEHARHAADHRAASKALQDAEARACGGIDLHDRDMSPFEHTEDITDVRSLDIPEANAGSKLPNARSVGAVVTFRAVPGMTAEWLQRLVECHLARNASLGHVVPEMPNCPLVVNGAQARVNSTGDGFAVEIRSDDPATAREITARAQRLRSGH